MGGRLIGVQGRRYKLWWSGNQEGYGGVGVLVEEECVCSTNVHTSVYARYTDRQEYLHYSSFHQIHIKISTVHSQSGTSASAQTSSHLIIKLLTYSIIYQT